MARIREILSRSLKGGINTTPKTGNYKIDSANFEKNLKEYLSETKKISDKLPDDRSKSGKGTLSKNKGNLYSNQAVEQAFEENLPMIKKIAGSYFQKVNHLGITWEELIQEGRRAVWGALKLYRPDSGAKFSTVVAQHMKNGIKEIMANSNLIYIPRNEVMSGKAKHEKFSSLNKEINPGDGDKAMELGNTIHQGDDLLGGADNEKQEENEKLINELLEGVSSDFNRAVIKYMLHDGDWKYLEKSLKEDPGASKDPDFKKKIKDPMKYAKEAIVEMREQAKKLDYTVSTDGGEIKIKNNKFV